MSVWTDFYSSLEKKTVGEGEVKEKDSAEIQKFH